jgi:hypothetical protein
MRGRATVGCATEERSVPRAHCLDCGDHVVVDPAGRCPEGHHVGVPGARIEGSLGTSHPDEPEPWVAKVVLDDELTATFPLPPRQARPLAAPPAPERGADPVGGSAAARSDDLLRELHSLGDLDGTSTPAASTPPVPPAAVPPVAPPVAPAVAAPAAAVPAPRPAEDAEPWSAPVVPPPTDRSAERDAFEELTALEAAVQALSGANGNGHHARSYDDDRNGQATTNGNGRLTGGHATANGNGHATNGHATANGNGHHTNGHGAGPSLDDLFGPELTVAARVDDGPSSAPSPAPAADPAPWSAPVSEVPRSVTEQLDELFAAADQAPAPPPAPRPEPPRPVAPPVAAAPPAPAPAPTPVPAPAPAVRSEDLDGPSRWSVLADVAELADSSPVADTPSVTAPAAPVGPPPAPVEAEPQPAAPPADPGIDLGNFTARGKRVGSNGKGKRRLFGR